MSRTAKERKLSNAAKARLGWGADLPDWVLRLAEECDAGGLNKTAAKMQLSPALVSLVIRKMHHADYAYAEARVRGMLMTPIISCPVLGLISAEQCRDQQQKPFMSVNPLAVAVYRACRGGCRYYAAQKGGTYAA